MRSPKEDLVIRRKRVITLCHIHILYPSMAHIQFRAVQFRHTFRRSTIRLFPFSYTVVQL